MFAQIATVLLLLVFVLLWSLAFWKQPRLAVGIAIGLALAWLGSFFVGDLRLDEIPVWLPALPFAAVATFLFVFGFLAWYWGRDEADATRGREPTSTHGDRGHGS